MDLGTNTLGVVTGSFLSACGAIVVNEQVMFEAVGKKLLYSAVDDGKTFTSTNYELFNDEIVDLHVLNGIVMVFCVNSIYTLTGNSTSTFGVKLYSNKGVGLGSIVYIN